MKKEEKLVNKIKHLVRKAKLPKYLNRYGPKIYEFWEHAFALITRALFRLSFRRTCNLLRQLGFLVATKSTLHRQAKTIPLKIWQALLKATLGVKIDVVAIDGTGLSRCTRSWHYIKRINGDFINSFYKLSVCVDIKKRKFVSIRLRARRASDIKDVKYLINRLNNKPSLCLMDKGYDAEWLHRFLHSKNIKAIIPTRNNDLPIRKTKGRFRKQMKKAFDKTIYNQRNIVESLIFAFKKTFGDNINSKLLSSAIADVYSRAIAYNLFLLLFMIRDSA